VFSQNLSTIQLTGARARDISRSVTFGPRAGRELSGACERFLVTNSRKSFHFILLQFPPRRENTRAKERGVRRASRAGSLSIGSGSSNPAVDRRRREDHLPASLVSTYVFASSHRLLATISASAPPPRERPQPAPQTPV